MCGRYSLVCISDIQGRFRVIDPMIGYRSHFNIAPGSKNPVIVRQRHAEAVIMQWGLIPRGVKKIASAPCLINARAETLTGKPLFSGLIQTRRCLVPASGFFEWKREGKKKVPFYFFLPHDPVFAFAGLYDTWQTPAGTTLATYTIITAPANRVVAPIHDRMPVILQKEDESRWLGGEPLMENELGQILMDVNPAGLVACPVSARVNDVTADDERVIAPLRGL